MTEILVAGHTLRSVEKPAGVLWYVPETALPHQTSINGHVYVIARALIANQWVVVSGSGLLGEFDSIESAVRAAEDDAQKPRASVRQWDAVNIINAANETEVIYSHKSKGITYLWSPAGLLTISEDTTTWEAETPDAASRIIDWLEGNLPGYA